MINRLLRYFTIRLLSKIEGGFLELRTAEKTYFLGDAQSSMKAVVIIHDARAYRLGLLQGEVGFGLAYMKGYWSSPDPVALVRLVVRGMTPLTEDRGLFSWLGNKINRLRHLSKDNHLQGSRSNIAHHYDLGNDFYQLWLDPTLAYSCAYYRSPNDSLEVAQIQKFSRIAEKLSLNPHDHLLEIGTGWGGFALYVAKHIGCRVTTTTISQQQFEYARALFEREGVSHLIDIRFEDYRLLEGTFSKIASIEMFEAVGLKHYDDYFGCISRHLKTGGLALIQTITMNETQWETYIKGTDWIQQYIFPGAELASLSEILKSLGRTGTLRVLHHEDIGAHYHRTLDAWRQGFWAQIDRVRALGYSDEFIRMWDWYLAYCSGAFAERYIGDSQLLLGHPEAMGVNHEPWS
ncbi:MAG: class I SAM-dependent methyltransferase [Holophagaceae bacterium]